MGPATTPRKRNLSSNRDKDTLVLRRNGSSSRSMMWWKPESRSYKANHHSLHKGEQQWSMECENHVWSRQDSGSGCRDVELYMLTLLGLSETWWTHSGQKKLVTVWWDAAVIRTWERCPSHPMMLSKTAQRALVRWETHGPRIIMASFQTKKKKIIMINVVLCSYKRQQWQC